MSTRSENGILKPKVYQSEVPKIIIVPSYSSPSSYSLPPDLNTVFTSRTTNCFATSKMESCYGLGIQCSHQNMYMVSSSLFSSHKCYGNMWVYWVKYRADGIVERYKARIVAKGFLKKKSGFNFFKTFSTIVKL